MNLTKQKLPVVYSCSGCSSAAQMSNAIAIKLDRLQLAEMSCIAGVGGDVASHVRKAKSAEKIIGIDGCPLHCVKNCLKRHGVEPTIHIDLATMNVSKKIHADYDEHEFEHVFQRIGGQLKTL